MVKALMRIVYCVALIAVAMVGRPAAHPVLPAMAPFLTTAAFFRASTPASRTEDDNMLVIAISHTVVSQREPGTHPLTGKRIHRPFLIQPLSEEDAKSLAEAKDAKVVFTRVLIHEGGQEIAKLDVVTIASITSLRGVHTVSLNYQSIEWK